jgi:hypothetical protein
MGLNWTFRKTLVMVTELILTEIKKTETNRIEQNGMKGIETE